jgi:hypothetical protein
MGYIWCRNNIITDLSHQFFDITTVKVIGVPLNHMSKRCEPYGLASTAIISYKLNVWLTGGARVAVGPSDIFAFTEIDEKIIEKGMLLYSLRKYRYNCSLH